MVNLDNFSAQIEELIKGMERMSDKEFLRAIRTYGDRLSEAAIVRLSRLLVMERNGATWKCMKCGGVNFHKQGCSEERL